MNLYERALAAFRAGANDQAASLAEELIQTSRASGELPGEIDGVCMLGRVALRRGELRRVAELAGEGRDLARQNEDPRLERMPLHLQAVAARMQGDFGSARQFYTESIHLNRQLGEERMVAAEHRNLAYVELHDGNAAEARELFSTSATLARASGYDALEPYLLLDSAVLALEMGDAARAAQLLKETDARFAAAGQIPDPDDAAEEEWLRKRLDGVVPDL
jgi:tetratricopeptide (TPR) repeat protein